MALHFNESMSKFIHQKNNRNYIEYTYKTGDTNSSKITCNYPIGVSSTDDTAIIGGKFNTANKDEIIAIFKEIIDNLPKNIVFIHIELVGQDHAYTMINRIGDELKSEGIIQNSEPGPDQQGTVYRRGISSVKASQFISGTRVAMCISSTV